ncbi:uncharacterized protein LACBIDRAFT_326777 [Laccaria bicolor S238N-H82]|uniref:Predicted protein n=1 Tax=Laccaria bicolor (strain S238N-H82 / ATCC MYA-4686) TaxID=486041 RepID=B0D9N0_LACBS|nr:uncharacterized protein LACBIDRAFT_326777 [Laccaria bicolor S238N-H82]EDR08608.1 predicted protein [Laccaria bicolor S238N-H82]|eukprot:XP_001880833.1 predicted protein [Laccaria bicolor S238N-H82]
MPVTKGDTLVVDSATLTQKEVNILWQQSLKSRSQEYYLVTYTNTTRASEGEHSGLLFIQKNMLDAFKAKHVAGKTEITFIVDDTFQYGQDKSQSHRWLAFHDKSQKMYQHRFVENTLIKFANAGLDIAEKLGVPNAKDASSVKNFISNYAGDYLHNF